LQVIGLIKWIEINCYWQHTHISLAAEESDFWIADPSSITIKKNTETSTEASKEVGLEIDVEKTKYMLLSRHQNVGRNRDIKIANRSFENVSQFR
jgi:hypothetical protein